MVHQVRAGYAIAGMEVKLPQVFIPRVMRSIIISESPDLSLMLNVVHHVAPTSPVTPVDVAAVNALVFTWATTQLSSLLASTITVKAVHTRSMEGLIVPTATTYGPVVGARGGEQLPLETALAVEWTTGLTGRRNKGSIHIGPATEADNTSLGHVATAYITDVGPVVTNLITSGAAGSYPLVVASFRYGTWQEVTGFVISGEWGTLVRRRQGRGR